MNIGGIVGFTLYGVYSSQLGLRRLAVFFMVGLSLMTMCSVSCLQTPAFSWSQH
jgi:hypothetical protein